MPPRIEIEGPAPSPATAAALGRLWTGGLGEFAWENGLPEIGRGIGFPAGPRRRPGAAGGPGAPLAGADRRGQGLGRRAGRPGAGGRGRGGLLGRPQALGRRDGRRRGRADAPRRARPRPGALRAEPRRRLQRPRPDHRDRVLRGGRRRAAGRLRRGRDGQRALGLGRQPRLGRVRRAGEPPVQQGVAGRARPGSGRARRRGGRPAPSSRCCVPGRSWRSPARSPGCPPTTAPS